MKRLSKRSAQAIEGLCFGLAFLCFATIGGAFLTAIFNFWVTLLDYVFQMESWGGKAGIIWRASHVALGAGAILICAAWIGAKAEAHHTALAKAERDAARKAEAAKAKRATKAKGGT